jgi:hypothetical protein
MEVDGQHGRVQHVLPDVLVPIAEALLGDRCYNFVIIFTIFDRNKMSRTKRKNQCDQTNKNIFNNLKNTLAYILEINS